jgi:hypothetical protein
MSNFTKEAAVVIEGLVEALDVPDHIFDSANKSYKSVCSWLERSESRFAKSSISAYIQGSFRLGTPIRPIGANLDYDLDVVFEFERSKNECTQKKLHDDLGFELTLYSKRYNMEEPSSWQRCWTLNYSDDARFHMDVLPAVPDGVRQLELRKSLSIPLEYAEKSISITDKTHKNYSQYSYDWPSSNPNGYADWFYDRMKLAFDELRKSMMLSEGRSDVTEIPSFRIKTPLQNVIKILKRHRDVSFLENKEKRPASIIITTLAAHAYQQERDIAVALLNILDSMDKFVNHINGVYWVPNPSDPRENFADAWNSDQSKRIAFFDWLEIARSDFRDAAKSNDFAAIAQALSARMGRQLIEGVLEKRAKRAEADTPAGQFTKELQVILGASHREALRWPVVNQGRVEIHSARVERAGFRPVEIKSGEGQVLPGSKLYFSARTTVSLPYQTYWQVVNTGAEAGAARDLRGGFYRGDNNGDLSRREDAKYSGYHGIECFVIKDGKCVARSGVFILNIR